MTTKAIGNEYGEEFHVSKYGIFIQGTGESQATFSFVNNVDKLSEIIVALESIKQELKQ